MTRDSKTHPTFYKNKIYLINNLILNVMLGLFK